MALGQRSHGADRVWRGERQTQQIGEKGEKEQKSGERLKDSSREGWKAMSREEENQRKMQLIFVSKKMPQDRRVALKLSQVHPHQLQ